MATGRPRKLSGARPKPRRNGRLLVVSNRLPFTLSRAPGGRWRSQAGGGGLVTALLPVLRRRGGTWIGWSGVPGLAGGTSAAWAAGANDAGCDIGAVSLNADDVRDFYHGFSNEVVWPLFHDLSSLCNFDPAYWLAYSRVNRKYAKAVAAHAGPRDFAWVHDYHLMRVASELRALGSRARLGFFLHIPFPSPDIFRRLPWRSEILAGLLDFDIVGFQSRHDVDNFLACVEVLAPRARITRRVRVASVTAAGRTTRVGAFPISIDYEDFASAATRPEVDAKSRELHALLPRRKLVLGIDRLDYTKGITMRLKAFHDLFERNPGLRGRLSLIQVVVPSREGVAHYERMKTEIEQLVGRINGAFGRPGGWVPVWYEYRSLTRLELLAYYRAADIALITPLKDGMNLVAKEYCACSIEEDCVLILSEAAGAAEQLGKHALLVNPYDIRGVASAIKAAHDMPYDERVARMGAMRRSIKRDDVYRWVDSYLAEARRAA